jgi:hypothetical protein
MQIFTKAPSHIPHGRVCVLRCDQGDGAMLYIPVNSGTRDWLEFEADWTSGVAQLLDTDGATTVPHSEYAMAKLLSGR